MTTSTSAPPKTYKRHVKGWLPHKSVLVVQGSQGDSWLVDYFRTSRGEYRLRCNCPRYAFTSAQLDGARCPHCKVAAEYLERPAFRRRMAQPNAREVSPEAHRMYVQTHGDHHRIIARREARLQSANSGPRLEDIFAG